MTNLHRLGIRSKIVRVIRSKDTVPEPLFRRALHATGLRYSVQSKRVLSTPDLVFRRYSAVVFVHGCLWHGQRGCRHFKLPQNRIAFW